MGQVVRITGINAEGRHGARAGERDDSQPFVVDLVVEVDAGDDDLGTTADYRTIVEAVRELIATESWALIETIAGSVATKVAGLPGVRRCRATVHKPGAADRLSVGDISAEAEATARGPG
ncbi:MAG: dihydroneopterin aldolase [Actinomycetota bacterium]|nr:dihydroneopterin aldolase [Actinomycetota bacterium]